jgi:transcriptional regulator with XRE-family HTH domain
VKSSAAASILHDARLRAGLSQRQLARLAHTSQAVISAYENGRRDPGFAHLVDILEAAGFALDMRLADPNRHGGASGNIWAAADSEEDDDRIRENLRLTPVARLRRMGATRRFTDKYRGAARQN